MQAGHHVVVTALGETPMDALDHHAHLAPQPPPDPATLAPVAIVEQASDYDLARYRLTPVG